MLAKHPTTKTIPKSGEWGEEPSTNGPQGGSKQAARGGKPTQDPNAFDFDEDEPVGKIADYTVKPQTKPKAKPVEDFFFEDDVPVKPNGPKAGRGQSSDDDGVNTQKKAVSHFTGAQKAKIVFDADGDDDLPMKRPAKKQDSNMFEEEVIDDEFDPKPNKQSKARATGDNYLDDEEYFDDEVDPPQVNKRSAANVKTGDKKAGGNPDMSHRERLPTDGNQRTVIGKRPPLPSRPGAGKPKGPRPPTEDNARLPGGLLGRVGTGQYRVKSGQKERSKNNDSVLSQGSKVTNTLALLDKHRGHPTIASLLEENQAMHNQLKYYNQKLTRMIDYRGFTDTVQRVRTGKKSAPSAKEIRVKNLQKEFMNNEKHLKIQMEDLKRLEAKKDKILHPNYMTDISREIDYMTQVIQQYKKEIHDLEVANRKETRSGLKEKYGGGAISKKPGEGAPDIQIAAVMKEIEILTRKNEELREHIEHASKHITRQGEHLDGDILKKETELKAQMEKFGMVQVTESIKEYKELQQAVMSFKEDDEKLAKKAEKSMKAYQKELEEIVQAHDTLQMQILQMEANIEKQTAELLEAIEVAKVSQSAHGVKILDRIREGIAPGHIPAPFTDGDRNSTQDPPALPNQPQHSIPEPSNQGNGRNTPKEPKKLSEDRPNHQGQNGVFMTKAEDSKPSSAIKPSKNLSASGSAEKLVSNQKPSSQKQEEQFDWLGTGSQTNQQSKDQKPQAHLKDGNNRDQLSQSALKSPLGHNQAKVPEESRELHKNGSQSQLKQSQKSLNQSAVEATKQSNQTQTNLQPDTKPSKPSQPSENPAIDPDLAFMFDDPAFKPTEPKTAVNQNPPKPAQPQALKPAAGIPSKPVAIAKPGPPRPLGPGGPVKLPTQGPAAQTNAATSSPQQLIDLDDVAPLKPAATNKPNTTSKPRVDDDDFDGFGGDEPVKNITKPNKADPFDFLAEDKGPNKGPSAPKGASVPPKLDATEKKPPKGDDLDDLFAPDTKSKPKPADVLKPQPAKDKPAAKVDNG